MDGMGLLVFLLLALSALTLVVAKEFHYIELKKNWTEAQRYCREKFIDLMTIENADDWERVIKRIEIASGKRDPWIGLYNDVKGWRWSLDNTSFYERDYGSWLVFNTSNNPAGELCAVLHQGKLWDSSCDTAKPSMCYNETSNSYIAVTDAKTWQSAQSYCRQTYTDLASIRNHQELNDVMSAVDTSNEYWIGLSREGWKWSDGSQSSFRQWRTGEPNGGSQACGRAHLDGLYDFDCEEKRAFICSVTTLNTLNVTTVKMLKVRLKTDGSVNPNDPLVRESLLKQMEKNLREQGLPQEFSLRWRTQPHGEVFNKTEL